MENNKKFSKEELRYLKSLALRYPNIADTATEIISAQAIMALPKGTEHFISDIHGEYAAFSHVLRNGSGSVRKKIDDVFKDSLTDKEKRTLATLIYYPAKKIRIEEEKTEDLSSWYKTTLFRLIELCKVVTSKHSRGNVRENMPKQYGNVIEELITEKPEVLNKEDYYNSIIDTIIEVDQAEPFIIALCELIQTYVIDRLHIIGDLFDRGSYPHHIIDDLMKYHNVDIEWGNHDVEWLGAACGQDACIATVIRNSVSYGNLTVLEGGYGVNLLPLVTFALDTYKDDPCTCFPVKSDKITTKEELSLNSKIHKAISIIQFKLEGQTILRHPDYNMNDRLLLNNLNLDEGTIIVDGIKYPLLDTNFPTIDVNDPYKLSEKEEEVVNKLNHNFRHCEKLQRHAKFLLEKGSIYKVINGNLLYHACIPLNEDGSFTSVNIYGKQLSGKALYEELEHHIRRAFYHIDRFKKQDSKDILWWLWCAPNSPLFGKSKMATLESYLIADKNAKIEVMNPYYRLIETDEVVDNIFKEFNLDPKNGHIINGHVPVHLKEGQKPTRCNGRVFVIDGGFAKAYQKVTGIAGYTLIYNSYGMTLAAHEPFVDTDSAIRNEVDVISNREMVYTCAHRQKVRDTDEGNELTEKCEDLKNLLIAYRTGQIKERH